jgi:hypothetical protein
MKLRSFRQHLERRESGLALALMRMVIGVSLLLEMGRYCLTKSGYDVLIFAFADVAHGGHRSVQGTLLLALLGGAKPSALLLLAWLDLLCGALLLVGLFGRLPAILAWLVTASILGGPSTVSGGSDLLLGAGLFTLALADCTRTMSLDCRLRTGSFSSADLVPAFPRIIALVQLTVMYGATGLQKLVSTAWLPADGFSSLYQVLQSPQWARFPQLIEDTHGALVWPAALATATTLLFELTFPIVLFAQRLRPIYAVFGLFLHLGIWVTMDVGAFSLLSLAFYPALFPSGFHHFRNWLPGRKSRLRSFRAISVDSAAGE